MVHKSFDTSHGERCTQRMQILYTRRTKEKQIFLDELSSYRKKISKSRLRSVIKSVGPNWYHALSELQREALDSLKMSIYKDLLEGRATETTKVIKSLGIYPRPCRKDLMNCIHAGRDDPKKMLAQMFYIANGHAMDGKRLEYSLNAKLILSAILYLGLEDLIARLEERFRPDTKSKKSKPKAKSKTETPLLSPYLQDMKAVLYYPERKRRPPPEPLPNLDALNEPFEDEPPAKKPPPPPPPPPPPKKRIPISYCDKLAGVNIIEPYKSVTELPRVTKQTTKKVRAPKEDLPEKKKYGLGLGNLSKGNTKKRKPKAPTTGIWNDQYVINGVSIIKGRPVYSLGSVSILPPNGDLIHGGYRLLNGDNINIHCGFRGYTEEQTNIPCDCAETWEDSIMNYLKNTKCYCRHRYDFGNNDSFPTDIPPYFEKPTKNSPYKINYDAIYNLDEKNVAVEKEFRRVWENDSMLCVDSSKLKKKKNTKSSKTCLGENPKEEDYLKCALNMMKRVNIAARLPEIYLVPELKEWMRYRIHGPLTRDQKFKLNMQSTTNWQMFLNLALTGYGHINPEKDPLYAGHSNWAHKQSLNDKFRKYVQHYRLKVYRSQARISNMFWATMCQAQMPDAKFREIFFTYQYSRLENLHLIRPYNTVEVAERKAMLKNKRYYCPAAGVADLKT